MKKNFLVVIITIIITLLAAEAVIRVISSNSFDWRTFLIYDREIGWVGKPFGAGTFKINGRKMTVRLNSLGLRSREPNEEVKDGILLDGDSQTWGLGLKDGETVTDQLEKFTGHNVYNIAQVGYGTDQELLAFLRFKNKYPAQKIILIVCRNDLQESCCKFAYGVNRPFIEIKDGRIFMEPVPKSDIWVESQWEKSYLIKFIISRWKAIADMICIGNKEFKRNRFLSILFYLKSTAEKNGAELSVFIIPPRNKFGGKENDLDRDMDMAAEICSELKIPFAYPIEEFAHAGGKKLFFSSDWHWNPDGARLAARIIADRLIGLRS